MYDAQTLLQSIDANKQGFLILSTVALAFNYLFFIAAALRARRDRAYAFPLFLCAFWLAHDVSFLIQFHNWFEVYNHWYLKAFWAGLVVTTALEMIFLIQFYRYGKAEVLPKSSQTMWGLYVVGGIVGAFVCWFSLRAALNDPLFAYSFGASGFLTPFFCLRLMLDRRDARGQSLATWIGYIGMQTSWFTATYLFWAQGFRSPEYVLLGVVCVTGGIAMAYMIHSAKTRHGVNEVAMGSAASA
ncbi:MAG: hypothetical protein ABWZ40_13000 [Caulobacterales bacterium]